jgi:hypothetical protein
MRVVGHPSGAMVEHQLAVVVQLQAEPVPADERGVQAGREELASIRRCRARPLAPGHPQRAVRLQPRERVVVGRLPRQRPLAAQATLAMEDRGLLRVQVERDGPLAGVGHQPMPGPRPGAGPVAAPDMQPRGVRAGQSAEAAPEPLPVMERLPLLVGDGEVGGIEVRRHPGTRCRAPAPAEDVSSAVGAPSAPDGR